MDVQGNIDALLNNHFCSIKIYGFVSVALVIRHEMRMQRIILSSVAPLAGSYSTLSQKGYELYKNVINRLTPNDPYMGRTAPLTSKR